MVKSEYGRAFKTRLDLYGPHHVNSCNYRALRRQAECNHNRDSFVWEDSDSETSDGSNLTLNGTVPRPLSAPVHIKRHEQYNKNYQTKIEQEDAKRHEALQRQLESNLSVAPKPSKGKTKRCKKTPPTVSSSSEDEVGQAETVQVEERQVQTPDWSKADLAASASRRPKKPSQTATFKVAKKAERPPARPQSSSHDDSGQDRRIFVPFGFQDKEIETALKRTYNVRSPVDVYPSALRAHKRRQREIKRREELAKSAPYEEKRKLALFNDFDAKLARDTAQWDTEYRSHYRGFEKALYERCFLAGAAVRRPKSPFTATI